MSEPDHPSSNPNAFLLGDALRKETREERRNLLGVSAVGIIIAKTGLIPSKIATLGIEFNPANQRSLLWITAMIVGYFLFAFLIYGIADFLAWRIISRTIVDKYLAERQAEITERRPLLKETSPRRLMRLLKAVKPVSWIRAFFEFVLPVLAGVIAIGILLHSAQRIPKVVEPPPARYPHPFCQRLLSAPFPYTSLLPVSVWTSYRQSSS